MKIFFGYLLVVLVVFSTYCKILSFFIIIKEYTKFTSKAMLLRTANCLFFFHEGFLFYQISYIIYLLRKSCCLTSSTLFNFVVEFFLSLLKLSSIRSIETDHFLLVILPFLLKLWKTDDDYNFLLIFLLHLNDVLIWISFPH